MGKAIIIIFAAVSFILLPVSFYYIGDNVPEPPIFTIDIQGNFYNIRIGTYLGNSGFSFFKLITTGGVIFTPDAWDQAYTNAQVFGMSTGTLMMICWYVAVVLAIVGIIVAIFKPKISGIFFILTACAYGFQALVWHLGLNISYPGVLHFPLPIGTILFLATAIIAFTTKKKEAYYYSPGYSYGYGKR